MNPGSETTGPTPGIKPEGGDLPAELGILKRLPGNEARWRIAAWAIWLIPIFAIAIMVAVAPEKRTVTTLYHAAAHRWAQRQPIYDGPAGMNYLPQFALLFAPWAFLGKAAGDILWRCAAAAGLFAGACFFCRRIWNNNSWRAVVFASVLMLPLCLPALRNGQANAHLGAVLLLAAWALQAQRWNLATALLCLSVAIKPLGLAAAGLALAAYPLLWWRLGLGFVCLGAAPFLFGPPDYVWSQFIAAGQNLRQCSEVTEHRFADLNGVLRTLGHPLVGKASLAVRLLAAMFFMGVLWLTSKRTREPSRALQWLGVSAAYLMLFNPMTEANSYVILVPVLALVAVRYLSAHDFRGWVVVGMALSMGLLPEVLRHWLHNSFALAWHPTMTLVFTGLLVWESLRLKNEVPTATVA